MSTPANPKPPCIEQTVPKLTSRKLAQPVPKMDRTAFHSLLETWPRDFSHKLWEILTELPYLSRLAKSVGGIMRY